DYGDMQLFQGATTYPIVLVIEKALVKSRDLLAYSRATPSTGFLPKQIEKSAYSVSLSVLNANQWLLVPKTEQELLKRLSNHPTLASRVGEAQLGVKTSLNEVFVVDAAIASDLIRKNASARDILRPFTRGRDITKWVTETNGSFLVCTREAIDINKYPSIRR